MRKRILSLYLACIEGERGKFLSLFRSLFFILSQFYLLVIKVRWLTYRLGVLHSTKICSTVISVGNITWGGTGKTPAIITIAKQLKEMGKKVAVLSRGYRRENGHRRKEISVVSDGQRVILISREAGDEPYLLAKNLSGIPVVVGKNRMKSGRYAIERFGTEVLLLDDGFQYLPMERDIDIVVIDCLSPYGNGYLIPRGQLREPISHLSRADIFLLTRTNLVSRGELDRITGVLKKASREALVIEAVHHPKYLSGFFSGEKKDFNFIKSKRIAAFSSIGNPRSFEKTLEELGAEIVKTFRFPDHHIYSQKDLWKIESATGDDREIIAVTTEKDGVRLEGVISRESFRVLSEIWILKVELEIIRGKEEWRRKIEFYV